MVGGVKADRIQYKTLTKLEAADSKVTVSSTDGNIKTYKLAANLGEAAIEIDKSNIIVDLNGNTIANVKVSADNVSFKNSAKQPQNSSITNLELTAKMTITKDEIPVLMKSVVANKGTLIVENGSTVEEIINSGNLTVAGIVNKISVSDGTVDITKDANLGNSVVGLNNKVTGGNVTIEDGATIPAGYFKVTGGTAISYSGSNCISGATDYTHIKGTDNDDNFFHAIVKLSDLKFDVRILDEDGEEVSGNLTKGQIYTISVVEYWNGLEVTTDNVGGVSLLNKTFKVTSDDVLVKYDGKNAEPNQYIAIADGKATFEITVENYADSDSANHLLKFNADSEHSTMKPAETNSEEQNTPTAPESQETTGNTTDAKNPGTSDNFMSLVSLVSASAAGLFIAFIKNFWS